MNRRQFFGLSVCLVIVLIVGVIIGSATGGDSPTVSDLLLFNLPWFNATVGVDAPLYSLNGVDKTDILQYPVQEASYIIWVDGSTYYAKNGITGKIDYSGPDAATVIQSSIDNLNTTTTMGGHIHILAGSYNITHTIHLSPYLKITGEERFTTRLNLEYGVNDNMFEATKDLYYGTLEFHDLYLNGARGSQTQGSAIYLRPGGTSGNAVYDPIFERLFIDYWKTFGIFMSGNTVPPRGGWASSITESIFEHSGTALYMQGSGDIRINNNKFIYNKRGILIDGGNSINIVGNFFYKNAWTALRARDNAGSLSESSVVIGNIFLDNSFEELGIYDDIWLENATYWIVAENSFGGLHQKAAIELESSSTYNAIHDNSISGTYATNEIIDAGANNEIKRNIGYITENAGTTTLLNGSTAIIVDHGCAYTPLAGDIQVHPIETLNNANFWWVDTITATQFTIHTDQDPSTDVDFAWSVDRH